jgi:hypothetical protein
MAGASSAKARFDLWKTSLIGYQVTDFQFLPNGIYWKQNGEARSAVISEVASGDTEYINTFKNLVLAAQEGGSTSFQKVTTPTDAQGQPVNYWPLIIIITGIILFGGKILDFIRSIFSGRRGRRKRR